MGGATSVSAATKTTQPISTPKPFMGISNDGWKSIGSSISDSAKLFGNAMADRPMPNYSGFGSVSYEQPQASSPMMNFNTTFGQNLAPSRVNQQPTSLQTALPPRTILGMVQSPRGSGITSQNT